MNHVRAQTNRSTSARIARARVRLVCGASVCAALLSAGSAHAEPPRFGIEVNAGPALGLSAYLRNEALVQPDANQPHPGEARWVSSSLYDVDTGAGIASALRLVASNISAGFSFQYFDLPARTIHHRGDRALPASRQRADGSLDDSGVHYRPMEPPIREKLSGRQRDALLVFGLGGDYRFYWSDEAFDVFVPLGADVILTHVTRPAAPYRLGLDVFGGVGTSVTLSSGISLLVDGRLHAVATSHYGRRADSARRSVELGESTETAFFSTLLYVSASVGLQFKIR